MNDNLDYIDNLAEKSWDTPKGTPPQGAWNAMNSRLFLQNFMQFSFFHFNIFYAAIIIFTIAGTTATVVLSNQREKPNTHQQPTDSLHQKTADTLFDNEDSEIEIHQETKTDTTNTETKNIKPEDDNTSTNKIQTDNVIPEKNKPENKQASVNDTTKAKTKKKKVIVVRKKIIVRDTVRKTDTIKKR